jgi:hypothetical protein
MIAKLNDLIISLMRNNDNLEVVISNERQRALLALEFFDLYFLETPLTAEIANEILEDLEGRLFILLQTK